MCLVSHHIQVVPLWKTRFFRHDAEMLCSVSGDETVILWDITKKTPISHYVGHRGNVNCVAVSPDSKLIATGTCGKWIFDFSW